MMRLLQGHISLQPGADIVTFVQHDGMIPLTDGEMKGNLLTLASLRDRYLETHANETLEAHALRGINRHFEHLAREIGMAYRSVTCPLPTRSGEPRHEVPPGLLTFSECHPNFNRTAARVEM